MKTSWLTICSAIVIMVIGLMMFFTPRAAFFKPALTQENASKIIPDGMRESDVYKVLGTGAVVSIGTHGERFLLYFFPFVSTPPRVDPKIVSMTVIISNGVVTGRQIPRSTNAQ